MTTTEIAGPTPYLESLNFELYLETSKPEKQTGLLLNRFEDKGSKLLNISIAGDGPMRWDDNIEDFIECDLQEKGFIGKELTLCNRYFDKKKGKNKEIISETVSTITNDVGYFTCAEVVDHILEFEKCDRPKTEWFGGIDCHHTHFEGLCPNRGEWGDGYNICWGS